jgi:hypothetical protein
MRACISAIFAAVVAMSTSDIAYADVLPVEHALLPLNPSSADNLKLSMSDPTCSRPNKLDYYSVKMARNNIIVEIPEQVRIPIPACTALPREEFDLGRLPAGNYTLTVVAFLVDVNGQIVPNGSRALFSNTPFTVTDARINKQAPWVTLDYTGQWWDPTDPGSGLFIWHDARDQNDALLAAWFTYSPDGKPVWYVFQPKFETAFTTFATDLLQTSRKPGPTDSPPNPTSSTNVGTAKLNFGYNGLYRTGDVPFTFTVKLKGQLPRVMNIQRFTP